MTAEAERRWALKAIEMGAFDFFRKPFEKSDLLHVGRGVERHRTPLAENRALKERSGSASPTAGSWARVRECARSSP